MKKVITLALALLMVCSMSVTAFAATTTLTTTVPEATYTLNIPANQEIPFGTTKASIGNITVTDAQGFAVGKNLNVTITYDVFSAEGISTQIPYTLSLYAEGDNSNSGAYNERNQELPTGSTITFAGTSAGAVEEVIKLETTYSQGGATKWIPVSYIRFNANSEDWGKALAGKYTTTITFTAEVVAE